MITVRFRSEKTIIDHVRVLVRTGYTPLLHICPEKLISDVSLLDQSAADAVILQPQDCTVDSCFDLRPGEFKDISFEFNLTQSAFLYIMLQKYHNTVWYIIEAGATFVGWKAGPTGGILGSVWRLTPDVAAAPISTPPPTPIPSPGLELTECVFPTLQWNLIQVLSDLVEWIGCILHNIITILQWIVDWFLHFPDHLDEWVSRLFGFDPAGNFWEQLRHDIDVRVSTRLGVDPDKPLLEEIVRKTFGWIFDSADAASREKLRKW